MIFNRRIPLIFLLMMILCIVPVCPDAHAEGMVTFTQGLARTVLSVFEIPKAMIQDSGQVIFPLGIVTGTVRGSAKMVGGVLMGAVDMVRGAAPYAKYAMLFI